MSIYGQSAIRIEEFGGLATLLQATNLPNFMSPLCQNVEFIPGAVKSRFGFTNVLSGAPLATSINYIKSYVMPSGDIRTLFADNLGNLWYEDASVSPGSQNLVFAPFLFNAFPNSVTQFGREYIAMGDGQQGYDLPRQYDGTNFDRISQEGPGQAPTVYDDVVNLATLASPNGLVMDLTQNIKAAPNGLSQVDDICTLVTQGGAGSFYGAEPGDSILVSGAGVAGYNGTFTILTITKFTPTSTDITITYQNPTVGLANSGGGTVQFQLVHVHLSSPHGLPLNFGAPFNPAPQVTISGAPVGGYNGTWEVRNTPGSTEMYVEIASFGLAASGSATVVIIGDIVGGQHQVSVMFQTRNGYITRPAPPATWTAGGSKRAKVINIPIGPSDVVARILIFTPVSSGNFFWIPSAGASLAVPSTIIPDNTTTSAVVNFDDSDLEDGVSADSYFDLLVLPPINGLVEYSSRLIAIGALNTVQNFVNISFDGGFSQGTQQIPLGWTPDSTLYAGGGKSTDSVFGDAYAITGTGSGITFGLMTQSASQDYLGNPVLQPGTAYTLSAYFKKNNSMIGVVASVKIVSASAGYSDGLTVAVGSQVNIGQFTKLTANLAALPNPIPGDLVLQIQSQNNLAGETVIIDEIEFVPTANPVQNSVALVSNVEDAESYNGITGLLQPTAENGQSLRSAFIIRDFLYLAKDRSLFVTQDNGSEPSGDTPWTINEVSQKVGTPSFRGIGIGDEWAVIASESGLWYFTGGILSDDSKLSTEIQPTWDSINWKYGYLLDVKVDTKRKRIYILCPMGTSTINNTILTLDYTQGFSDPMGSNGSGRKWAPWTVGANSQNLVVRPNQTLDYYVGGNNNNAKVMKYDPSATTDNTDAINAFWQSGYFQSDTRINFGYLQANVVGTGTMNLTLKKGDQSWVSQIRGWVLNTLGFTNMERQIQKQGFRMSVLLGTNSVDAQFSLQGLSMYVTDAVAAPVRGINS